MELMQFLITILFELFLMVVILRVWLQAARADFYNPVSQFVVKATNPLVLPLRKVIPMVGVWDLATIVLALLVSIGKFIALYAALGYPMIWADILLVGVLSAISQFLQLLFWIVIIRALLSWFAQGYNPMQAILVQLTEPFLAPIRRIIPPIGGLDLSVLVLVIGIQALRILIGV
ncbi:YggT family protein [Pseudidiomarina sp. 1ASP75-14]|uniref:YggT family protein n=1 Tax=Pseudidiomarina terrestris TaxID=2820060 RepID=UPI002653B394|nr:YggT family protein [Pseudidiomarina sp. 1ASP75-14]MDN7138862.1 YggT family protein [Pseudidiomarina sp. 1ASP75-14]